MTFVDKAVTLPSALLCINHCLFRWYSKSVALQMWQNQHCDVNTLHWVCFSKQVCLEIIMCGNSAMNTHRRLNRLRLSLCGRLRCIKTGFFSALSQLLVQLRSYHKDKYLNTDHREGVYSHFWMEYRCVLPIYPINPVEQSLLPARNCTQ